MHLWTEYEGRTIAENYTLGKLLRSEGRNGFFATADKDGHPAVIRLTEAHYDEDEQLRRWRHVAEVHQDNLIEIEQVGRTTFEGVALTYALMEPDDANLGDVLKERPLTTAETLQVAKAVLLALRALHTSGLVHEHVEPANVLAVGETVKLRSDCVRECIADGEFNTEDACAEVRRRDIHDFGLLLLRCLTLESEWIPAHNNLPDPFKRIIPRALDGSWSLEQLGNAVDPTLFAPRSAAKPAPSATAAPSAAPSTPAAASAAGNSVPSALREPAAASMPTNGARPLVPPSVQQGTSDPVASTAAKPRPPRTIDAEPTIAPRARFRPEPEEAAPAPSKVMWAGVAVAALVLLLIGWHFLFGSKNRAPASTAQGAPVVSSGAVSNSAGAAASNSAPAAQAPVAPSTPAAIATPPAAATSTGTQAAGAPGWYVIAYTYNHEGQAAEKAKRLRRNHNSMNPQVFTPTGHAPYFVSLGGPMASQGEAESVYRHARRSGLPRDTFVRHF